MCVGPLPLRARVAAASCLLSPGLQVYSSIVSMVRKRAVVEME